MNWDAGTLVGSEVKRVINYANTKRPLGDDVEFHNLDRDVDSRQIYSVNERGSAFGLLVIKDPDDAPMYAILGPEMLRSFKERSNKIDLLEWYNQNQSNIDLFEYDPQRDLAFRILKKINFINPS